MDIKQNILEHYKRWNIEIDEQEEFEKIKNRLSNNMSKVFRGDKPPQQLDYEFANLCGYRIAFNYALNSTMVNSISLVGDRFESSYIYQTLVNSKTIVDLAKNLQFLLLAVENTDKTQLLDQIAGAIQEAIYLSPIPTIKIVKYNDSVIIYPAGAKLLDEKVVNDVLYWLESYPTIEKAFAEALIIYQKGEKTKYRNLLDNLRFALEQLFQEVLDNSKSLENQKEVLLKWLRDKGIYQQIINLYQQIIFGQYCKYQNKAVKHGEGYSEKEIEFMIYQTGTLMRLILQLNEE